MRLNFFAFETNWQAHLLLFITKECKKIKPVFINLMSFFNKFNVVFVLIWKVYVPWDFRKIYTTNLSKNVGVMSII